MDKNAIFVTIMLLTLGFLGSGCVSAPKEASNPYEYAFEKTAEISVTENADGENVTVDFSGVPFSQAMTILVTETGVPIVWSKELDTESVVGRFDDVPLATVLDLIARRSGSEAALIGGVYFLGKIERQDRAFAVLRLPPISRTEIETAVKASVSTEAAVSIVGSCLWICDNLESLRKVTSAIEMIRERSERSYVAEMYFIRVSESHFVQLTADLQIKGVDVFSSAVNIEELFAMFLDADAETGVSQVLQRPVLYLSEGRSVTFSDGKEITRERKTLAESGALETTGYQRFADGLHLTMLLNRVSEKSYAVDVDLSVSIFDKSDKSEVPAMDKSSLQSEGMLVQDSKVYYVGSLKRVESGKKAGLFSFDGNKSADTITIWLRVRELKNG